MESPTVRPGRTTRIVAAVVVTTVAGILLAATFFRRRRRKSHRKKQNGAVPQKQREAPERNIPMPVRPSDRSTEDAQTVVNVHSQHNGSPPSPSPDRTGHSRTHSTASVSQLADEHIQQSPTEERDEVDGPSLPTPSPQEMIHLGAASIDSALRYWEEALEMKTTQDGEPTEETGRYEDLRSLLKRIKDLCSDYIELSAMNFDPDARGGDDQSDTSSVDSFHSLGEEEELSLLENGIPAMGDELYQAAMIAVRRNQVQCRTNRANMLNCESREDYLAKVHCIRQALRLLMSDTTMRDWFASMGMQLIADILSTAGYATEDFYVTFEKMMEYVKKPENLTSIEQELRNRKVKDFSFYDAVLDFFLLDAFDDLEDPPASVISIVQNRWLSQSVKETGLGAAIWSVLAAKKQMLKNPRGFMGHCYDISKHVTPALAWGFMGTDEELKGLMNEFKDQVLLFTRSMFSREKCRYSTVAELADDIFALAREIFTTLNQRLSDCPR